MASQKEYEMLYKLNAQLGSSFSGTFRSAVSTFTELQGKMVEVNETQADIAAYQKQQQAVENTRAKLEMLQKQYDNIQKEYEETGEKSSSLANRMLQKQAAIDKTASALQSETNKLNTLEAELEEAGVDTKNLESESKRLEAEMEDLQAATIEAADGAEEFGESGTTAISDVGAMLAAAGIERALKAIYDGFMDCVGAAADFEQSMSNVEALSGASSEELQQLSETAKEMGATTSFTAKQSADAFSYMALAGWDTEAMLEGISPVLSLAAAANMDLAQASDIVTDYLTAFGLSAEDTAGFVDQMAYAMAHSNTNVEQLGEAYKAVAATATSLGYSVEETTAALMVMANAGVKGGEAGTALNAVMTRLATDTQGCSTALEEYGIHVYDTEGNMNSLSSILTGMSSIWGTLTDQEQANLAKTIAGTKQYSKLQTIMAGCSEAAAEGGQSFSDYAAALEDCAGTAGEMADTMLDNLNGQLTLMKSAFDGLKITIGEQFQPEMSKLYSELTEILGKVTEFVEENPQTVKALASLVGGIAAATAAITALAAAKKVMAALDLAAMFTSPVGAVVALTGVLGGLIGVYDAIFDNANEEAYAASTTLRALTEDIRDAESAYAEQTAEIDANSANIMGLIARLQELTSQSEVTAAEQAEINAIVSELNAAVPGLALEYDGLTNSMNLTTDAIIAMAQAQANQEKITALNQELISLMDARVEVEGRVAEAETELADAQAAYDVALQEYNAHVGEAPGIVTEYADALNNAREDLDDAKEGYNDANGALTELNNVIDETASEIAALSGAEKEAADESENLEKVQRQNYRTMLQLQYAAKQVADGTMDADQAAKAYGLDVDALNDYISTQEDYEKSLSAALAMVEGGYLSAEQAASAYNVALDDLKVAAFTEALDNLTAKYGEVYTAAYESMSGQFDLWDEAAEVSATSMATLQSNLQSQVDYWNNYNANLASVAQAAQTAGIDISSIWDSLSSGSPDAVNAVAGMAAEISNSADGGASSLQTYVDTYQELQDALGGAAETIATNNGDVQAAFEEFQGILADAAVDANLADEFSQSATDTIQGYIDAWTSEQGAVGDQLSGDAKAWLDAFNAALGVHSPSTITNQSGVDTMTGYDNGIVSMESTVNSTMISAAQQAIDAFKSTMSSSVFYSAGVNAMQGAIQGIRAMQSSLVATARAAGTAAANAYKAAQDIHSPSKLFYWFSEMDIQGAIQGFEDNEEALNQAARASALAGASGYWDALGENRESSMTNMTSAMFDYIGGGKGAVYYITVSPSYHIEGNSDAVSVRRVLEEHTSDLKGYILDVVEEAGIDTTRSEWT